ncbi:hypothetical protein BR93DRAFT_217844 [Coniochaeta sp. PMI_546]|nr:hypothetical protein BR93DRAFT_217844 [Coniochaeta sp. PMI_546]
MASYWWRMTDTVHVTCRTVTSWCRWSRQRRRVWSKRTSPSKGAFRRATVPPSGNKSHSLSLFSASNFVFGADSGQFSHCRTCADCEPQPEKHVASFVISADPILSTISLPISPQSFYKYAVLSKRLFTLDAAELMPHFEGLSEPYMQVKQPSGEHHLGLPRVQDLGPHSSMAMARV